MIVHDRERRRACQKRDFEDLHGVAGDGVRGPYASLVDGVHPVRIVEGDDDDVLVVGVG